MATTAYNNIKRNVAGKSVFESALNVISSSTTFNQGDQLYLDTSTHTIKPVAADGNNATYLGVAPVSVSNGKLVSPYQGTAVDAAQAIGDIPGPVHGVIAELTLNTGDAFQPGAVVYAIGSVDAQTVSSSSNTGARVATGIYQGPAVASAAAGQKGLVLVGCAYQAGTLSI